MCFPIKKIVCVRVIFNFVKNKFFLLFQVVCFSITFFFIRYEYNLLIYGDNYCSFMSWIVFMASAAATACFSFHMCVFFLLLFFVCISSNLLSQMLFTNEVAISIKSIAQYKFAYTTQHTWMCFVIVIIFTRIQKKKPRGIESEFKQVKLSTIEAKHTHTQERKKEIAACVWHLYAGIFSKYII